MKKFEEFIEQDILPVVKQKWEENQQYTLEVKKLEENYEDTINVIAARYEEALNTYNHDEQEAAEKLAKEKREAELRHKKAVLDYERKLFSLINGRHSEAEESIFMNRYKQAENCKGAEAAIILKLARKYIQPDGKENETAKEGGAL
ncbi:hypothetical protein [uncultured Prevotella sp.]|jgi:hypothetical protein|uniref:hypothetical protein n=1 Tax=uncultured Prevotella sp. TaxID=159272 RepID=UPI0026360A0A|nr:hypothetical protein [uncultured Prevotella sp.]